MTWRRAERNDLNERFDESLGKLVDHYSKLNKRISAGSDSWYDDAIAAGESERGDLNFSPTEITKEPQLTLGLTDRSKELATIVTEASEVKGGLVPRDHPSYESFVATLSLVKEIETYFRLMSGRYYTLGDLGIVKADNRQARTRKSSSELVTMVKGRLSGRYGTLAHALTGNPSDTFTRERYQGVASYRGLTALYRGIDSQLDQASTSDQVEARMAAKGAHSGNEVEATSVTPGERAAARKAPRPK